MFTDGELMDFVMNLVKGSYTGREALDFGDRLESCLCLSQSFPLNYKLYQTLFNVPNDLNQVGRCIFQ